MAQVRAEAGAGLRAEVGRGEAAAEGAQGAEQQLAGDLQHIAHILHFDAVVDEVGHQGRDQDLHGGLAEDKQRREHGRELILAHAACESLDHRFFSSVLG